MKRKKGSIGSSRATTRRSKRIAENVDDEQESQQLEVSFDDLPSHIIVDILLRLPIKSILICKCVCISWKALISDPHFAKLHIQHAPAGLIIRAVDRKLPLPKQMYLLEGDSEKFVNDDDGQFCYCHDSYIKPECNCHFKLEHKLKLPLCGAELDLDKRDVNEKRGRQRHYISCNPEDVRFNVVNSCNGLLCLSDSNNDDFVVCNPVTCEFVRLPEVTTRIVKTRDMWPQESYKGFGFHPKTNEYKVVRIFKGRHPLQEYKVGMAVEIHTLGTSTWRNVEVDPGNVYLLQFPTCVSGALYWIGYLHNKLSILCFEFESENFQSFPSPPYSSITDIAMGGITIGQYEGCLYICSSTSEGLFKMWIMKKNGFEESWTNVFSIDIMSRPNGSLYCPLKHFKNGAAIFLCCSFEFDCFIYYEPETYGFKKFKVCGTLSKFEAIPHIPSLISLKDAAKGDNIEVMNFHSRRVKLKLQEEKEAPFLAKVQLTSLCYISSDDEE